MTYLEEVEKRAKDAKMLSDTNANTIVAHDIPRLIAMVRERDLEVEQHCATITVLKSESAFVEKERDELKERLKVAVELLGGKHDGCNYSAVAYCNKCGKFVTADALAKIKEIGGGDG